MALTYGVPQSSIVWPQQFVAYTEDVEKLIETFNVKNHLYADDTRVLADMHLNKVQRQIEHRKLCAWNSRPVLRETTPAKPKWFGLDQERI